MFHQRFDQTLFIGIFHFNVWVLLFDLIFLDHFIRRRTPGSRPTHCEYKALVPSHCVLFHLPYSFNRSPHLIGKDLQNFLCYHIQFELTLPSQQRITRQVMSLLELNLNASLHNLLFPVYYRQTYHCLSIVVFECHIYGPIILLVREWLRYDQSLFRLDSYLS